MEGNGKDGVRRKRGSKGALEGVYETVELEREGKEE